MPKRPGRLFLAASFCSIAATIAAGRAPAADEGASIAVAPRNAVIVVASVEQTEGNRQERRREIRNEAAAELQKHLQLITGVEIPITDEGAAPAGKYLFRIGTAPEGAAEEFAPRECRWRVAAKSAYFYGDKTLNSLGVQDAVYDFLERQLGVRWIEPGDGGIVFKRRPTLVLKAGEQSWIPKLMFNKIRQCYRVTNKEPGTPPRLVQFPEFHVGMAENNKKAEDDMRWQRRMKMGGSRPGGGHAFTEWWDKHGKTHPEYFALNKFGKREPVKHRKPHYTNAFVKICPSNPAVVEQIVKNWLPRKGRVQYVNVGVNDSNQNFCECANCRKLDVRLEGEKFEDHLTDRYVYLANAVAREVRRHRKDAYVTMYAYLATLPPPRKLKVEPNVVVQVVPYVIPLDLKVTEELIEGWYKAGAKKIAFRPNYHFKYHPFPMPLGIEKQMFDVFQLAVKSGCISADYDSLAGCWNLTGMADYVLARALAEPDKPFSHWEDQYCSAFGAASDDAKEYFGYWRKTVWEGRLKPNLKSIARNGRYGNFARGLAWAIHHDYIRSYKPEGCAEYYNELDFDRTDEILRRAVARDLTPEEKKRVEQLILINQHSRLEFGAMHYQGTRGYQCSKDLLAFRTEHRTDMHMSWGGIFYSEDVWGDICNLILAKHLGEYPLPWVKTPFQWRFRIDEKDVGLKERWQEGSWEDTVDWKPIRVNVYWSNTYESPYAELKKTLKTYDGIGWYTFRVKLPQEMKGRKVFLYFGGVDDSCKVYVNGKFTGEHLAMKPGDKDAPFEIPMDAGVDWNSAYQGVTVRVEDLGGKGGVHKETWVVSKTE